MVQIQDVSQPQNPFLDLDVRPQDHWPAQIHLEGQFLALNPAKHYWDPFLVIN
jgi:hypothetical protein